jgi:hypothetical protein
LFFDIGAAVGVGALLSVLIGPFFGGARPFAEGLGNLVGELLMFLGIAGVGVLLGFWSVVAVGKDWRGRRLRRFTEQHHGRRIIRG